MTWSDERDKIMELLDGKTFPAECPCCGQQSGHLFFYKNEEIDRMGGAWAWCSNCMEFSHSRHETPGWWRNMPGINPDRLHAVPDQLDKIKEDIDAWVNMLSEPADKGCMKELMDGPDGEAVCRMSWEKFGEYQRWDEFPERKDDPPMTVDFAFFYKDKKYYCTGEDYGFVITDKDWNRIAYDKNFGKLLELPVFDGRSFRECIGSILFIE